MKILQAIINFFKAIFGIGATEVKEEPVVKEPETVETPATEEEVADEKDNVVEESEPCEGTEENDNNENEESISEIETLPEEDKTDATEEESEEDQTDAVEEEEPSVIEEVVEHVLTASIKKIIDEIEARSKRALTIKLDIEACTLLCNISISEIAEKFGVSVSTIRRGQKALSDNLTKLFNELCEKLGLDSDIIIRIMEEYFEQRFELDDSKTVNLIQEDKAE